MKKIKIQDIIKIRLEHFLLWICKIYRVMKMKNKKNFKKVKMKNK
jgi:hypothetical protein